MTLTLSTDDYYLTMHIPPVPLSVTFKRNIEFLWDNRYCPNAPNTFPDLQKKSEQKRKRTTIRSALLNSVNLISQYNFVRTVQHYYMALSLYYFFFLVGSKLGKRALTSSTHSLGNWVCQSTLSPTEREYTQIRLGLWSFQPEYILGVSTNFEITVHTELFTTQWYIKSQKISKTVISFNPEPR